MVSKYSRYLSIALAVVTACCGFAAIFTPWYYISVENKEITIRLYRMELSLWGQTSLYSFQEDVCDTLEIQDCAQSKKMYQTSAAVIGFIALSMAFSITGCILFNIPRFPDIPPKVLVYLVMLCSALGLIIYPMCVVPFLPGLQIPLNLYGGFWIWLVCTLVILWIGSAVVIDPFES